ncbi:MAG: zinc dependent phospholipase C family protein [Anaerolineae bacterium]|nr:zinc dependent phospholipase C family protein [Anaerolineae bacterium]
MPTPFTHLAVAQRLLTDPAIPGSVKLFLRQQRSAFLLGNIAADARVNSGTSRTDTHFYSYDKPIEEHPWRLMLRQHPVLQSATAADQQAFLAGYVAHLAMDEYWSLNMLAPYFVRGEWETSEFRFFMLHIILIYMDERDYGQLEDWQCGTLEAAQPDHWLPFMDDDTLRGWRDFIARQIAQGSETLEVFGGRIKKTPAEFRAELDSVERMQADLWDHISHEVLAQVEADMYQFAQEQMLVYLREYTTA